MNKITSLRHSKAGGSVVIYMIFDNHTLEYYLRLFKHKLFHEKTHLYRPHRRHTSLRLL